MAAWPSGVSHTSAAFRPAYWRRWRSQRLRSLESAIAALSPGVFGDTAFALTGGL
jgi:hypothetical protein